MDSELVVTPERPRAKSRWRVAAYTFAVLATLAAVMTNVRLGAYSIGPGPARNVGELVKVEGERTFTSSGAFLLTTVSVSSRPITLFEGVVAWLDPAVRVIDRDALIQPGVSDKAQDIINLHDMEESKLAAEVVVLRSLGKKVREIPGARVMTVIPDTPADGVLEKGDVIVAVDGSAVRTPEDAVDAIGRHEIGEEVEVTFVRDGSRETETLTTADSEVKPGNASTGITIGPAFDFPVRVDINTDNIGGPSGGLVFSLALADALAEEDLTAGHRIAATGTIDFDGTIGSVGGVEEKVLAAERAGAKYFLVPAGAAQGLTGVPDTIEVIEVKTFPEALEVLRGLPKAGS